MLRRPRDLGLVVVLAVILTSAFALAQEEGGGRGGRGGFGRGGFGMGGPMMAGMGMGGLVPLAAAPPVQKELDLDQAAIEKVQKLAQEFPQEMMAEMEKAGLGFGSFQQLQEVPEEERPAKMREMNEKRNEAMKKVNDKFVPQLKEAISSKQFERLQQIHWQAVGSQALESDTDLGKALDVNKEQREKIAKINEDADGKIRDLFGRFGRGGRGGGGPGGGPPDFQAINKKRQEITKERDTKATEVLDEEQQKTYANLKGKPFAELAQLQAVPGMGMGRGGFGGRGGPPGGFGGGRGGRGGFGRGPDPEGRPRKKAVQGEDKDEGEKKE
jgi:hypothetical protein